jgi:hypothetical protein
MANRKQILNQLHTDLGVIDSTGGVYLSDVHEIIHGIVSFDQIMVRPAIAYFMTSDEVDQEYLDDQRYRRMYVTVYGYADTCLENFDGIYNLAEDVERFFYSNDWTYTNQTLLGDIEIMTGGDDNTKSLFIMEIVIQYSQDL